MRKKLITVLLAIISALFIFTSCSTEEGKSKEYVLTETTFFRVMNNALFFPQQYLGSTITLDCFTYSITDVENGKEYICGVRQCSSGYGCTCGNDTIIGFILNYDGEIPAPKNQSTKDSDKSWIHISGMLKSDDLTKISIQKYDSGEPIEGESETIYFLEFNVTSLETIEDASNLNYYVSK